MNDRLKSSGQLPERLIEKLGMIRQRLVSQARWRSARLIVVGLMASLVAMLVFDRLMETPVWIRCTLLLLVICVAFYCCVRLVQLAISSRGRIGLAKIVRRQDPIFGDHLLGALELAESKTEQSRSPALCAGALDQVAAAADRIDVETLLPIDKGHFQWRVLQVLLGILAVAAFVALPMVINSLKRLCLPLSEIPRMTFVSVERFEDPIIVPRDEPILWDVGLDDSSRWAPGNAKLSLDARTLTASCSSDLTYTFDLPPLINQTDADLRIGDAWYTLRLQPKLRPIITDIKATVVLPQYLRQYESLTSTEFQVRGDSVELLQGSQLHLAVTISDVLSRATVDGQQVDVDVDQFKFDVAEGRESVEFEWVDQDGLECQSSRTLKVRRVSDRRPSVLIRRGELPARILQGETLKFEIQAEDDYRIRRVGLDWKNGERSGEQVIGGGGREASFAAAIQASALGLPPGKAQIRFWVQDDLPGREKVYADTLKTIVMSPAEHAVWIAGELNRWQQSAIELHDRELSLLVRNRELSETAVSKRDDKWRQAVAEQAVAEAQNGRKLKAIASTGEDLLRQAARNSEVDVDYVEQLAGMIKTLDALADDRMPKVASLLKRASEEQESKFEELADQESTQGNLIEKLTAAADKEKSADSKETDSRNQEQSERVSLAETTIIDTSGRKRKRAEQEPEDSIEQAVESQDDLVAEFDAVADELRELLGNMEGSTLVKRLKSVSRLQNLVATTLGRHIESTFGKPKVEDDELLKSVEANVVESRTRVHRALDDLEAFCERRKIDHFLSVLNEMKQSKVLQHLDDLEHQIATQPGVSMATAEFWSDNLDRWADDLVDPGDGNANSGQKSKGSLSPEVVLEVLRILESEVNLRERTRVAEQGRAVNRPNDYMSQAVQLSESQDLLRDRLDVVIQEIQSKPEATLHFANEIDVLSAASAAMVDATKTLAQPETGPAAIAAETEAIELLLRSKKVNPEGGSASGGSATGGQGGETDQAAVALLGKGINELAQTRNSDTELAVGRRRGQVPIALREGLQQYHQRLEVLRATIEQPMTHTQNAHEQNAHEQRAHEQRAHEQRAHEQNAHEQNAHEQRAEP